MNSKPKWWTVVYKHPFNGNKMKAAVFGRDKGEAMQQAMENNVPTYGNSFFWEIESLMEN